jgi:hypothetical protein
MTHRVIILAAISVLLSCTLAALLGGSPDAALERAVSAAEPVVRSIADRGPGALFDERARADLRGVDGQSTSFALLGAWSKLSIGRVGILEPDVAARLPWLVVASLGPAALYAILAPWWGGVSALFAFAWLLALPGWTVGCARATDGATLAGAILVAFGFYLGSLPRRLGRRSRHAHAFAALCAGWLALGVAMSRAVLVALLLVYVDFAVRNRAVAERAGERGLVLLPSALVLSLAVAPVAFIVLDPALYGSTPSAIVGELFRPGDARTFSLWQFMLPALAVLGAWVSRAFCLRFVPPHFATAVQGAFVGLVACVNWVV